MNECWRQIPGYEDRYQVSDLGRVRSIWRGKMRPTKSSDGCLSQRGLDGYLCVSLWNGCARRHFLVHRLVLAAFEGAAPADKPEGNHKNGVRGDNRLSNLEWASRSENVQHMYSVLGYRRIGRHRLKIPTP